MRHEKFPAAIHPMQCRCDKCRPAMDSELIGDLLAAFWGCIIGAGLSVALLLNHFWPAIRAALFG